jgi:hypothetical protein
MQGGYALPINTGSRLLVKVSKTSCEEFNRKVFSLLDSVKSMEYGYQVMDPLALTRDPNYVTLGPIALLSTLQHAYGQLITTQDWPALACQLPQSNNSQTKSNLRMSPQIQFGKATFKPAMKRFLCQENHLEDLRVRLEAMGSSKSENQFMIHILNNLTSDYEIQLALMEKRVGDMEKPLTIEEIRGEVSLLFERMNMKSSNNKEGDNFEDTAFLPDSLKENVAIAVKSGTNRSNARIEDLTMAEITVTQVAVIFACIVVSLAMIGRIVSSSRRRIHDPTMPVQIMVTLTNQSLTHKMKFSRLLQMMKRLINTFGFVVVDPVHTTV